MISVGKRAAGFGKRGAYAAGLGVLAGVGAMQSIGTSAREAMMESAFGDPNADRAFLGSNLSGRFLVGALTGGVAGGAMQLSAPSDFMKINAPAPNAGMQIASAGLGGLAGVGVGATVGTMLGKKIGGKKLMGSIGGMVGGLIGGSVGAAAPLSYTAQHMRNNSNFFSKSPYTRSRQMADELSASGDIVLGMHNARGGY
jgi:hypothetical protein